MSENTIQIEIPLNNLGNFNVEKKGDIWELESGGKKYNFKSVSSRIDHETETRIITMFEAKEL